MLRIFWCVAFGFQFLLLPSYVILHYQFMLCTQRNERMKYLIFLLNRWLRAFVKLNFFFEWPALRDNSGARIEIKWIFSIDEKSISIEISLYELPSTKNMNDDCISLIHSLPLFYLFLFIFEFSCYYV